MQLVHQTGRSDQEAHRSWSTRLVPWLAGRATPLTLAEEEENPHVQSGLVARYVYYYRRDSGEANQSVVFADLAVARRIGAIIRQLVRALPHYHYPSRRPHHHSQRTPPHRPPHLTQRHPPTLICALTDKIR